MRIVAGSRRFPVLCELAASGDTAAGVTVTGIIPVPVIIGYEDDDQIGAAVQLRLGATARLGPPPAGPPVRVSPP